MPLRPLPLLLAVLIIAVSPARRAAACAPIVTDLQTHVEVVDESAIIVWDEANQTEHFIRRATFDTKAHDLGFLVPTPGKPKLTEVNEAAFDWLQLTMEPEYEHRKRWRLNFSPLLASRRIRTGFSVAGSPINISAATGAAAPPAVTVLATQRVAGYDTAVLEASDPAALNGWLKKHGYVSNPALTAWLAPYVAAHWKITAFKFAKKEAGATQLGTSAVRMSFTTEHPFFPYREPTTQRSGDNHAPRTLRVFFLGPQRMAGTLGAAGVWPGRTVWTDALQDKYRVALPGLLKLDKNDLFMASRLTVFEDNSSPRPGTDDVFFKPASDQSRIVPEPIIIWDDRSIPVPLDAIAALGLIGWFVFSWFRPQRRGV